MATQPPFQDFPVLGVFNLQHIREAAAEALENGGAEKVGEEAGGWTRRRPVGYSEAAPQARRPEAGDRRTVGSWRLKTTRRAGTRATVARARLVLAASGAETSG